MGQNVISALGSINWSGLLTSLTASGVDPTTALSAVKALASNSHLKTQLQASVQSMIVNMGNDAALNQLALQIETTPSVNPEIIALVGAAVSSAKNPVAFMQAIGQLEAVINGL